MDVATWNVNSIRARAERAWAWLAKHEPSVLCMQETKVVDDAFPTGDARSRGYEAALYGQKTYNGVAILSKLPMTDVTRGFGDGEVDDQARLIAATTGGVRVICVYVPNGRTVGSEAYEYKLRWYERLRAFLDNTCDPASPVLLCGDFNVAPEARDIYDARAWEGKIMCSDGERAALANVVEWGFTDAFRMFHEQDGLFSWWDYRQLSFQKRRGLRIDHVFITKPLVERCTECFIDKDERRGKGPSDHAPVIARFG